MDPEWHLRIAGALQILLALLHLAFPKRFQWKEELARLSPLNRQIFLVHTFFICVVLTLIGALSQTRCWNNRACRIWCLAVSRRSGGYVCSANSSCTTPACGAASGSTR